MSSFSLVSSDPAFASKPFIDGDRVLLNGKIFPWTGDVEDVTSPILDSATGKRLVIGRMARMDAESSVQAFESAKAAWKEGAGEWPQMPANQRISAVLNLVTALKKKRDEIVTVLQWEICKTRGDAEAEFDRTMVFIHASIEALTEMDEREGNYVNTGGVFGRFRRAAIGVMLALGPFNYPFNETYTTIIPALLMGNTIVMKIPTTGASDRFTSHYSLSKYLF